MPAPNVTGVTPPETEPAPWNTGSLPPPGDPASSWTAPVALPGGGTGNRPPLIVGAAVLTVVLLGGGVAAATMGRDDPRSAAPPATGTVAPDPLFTEDHTATIGPATTPVIEETTEPTVDPEAAAVAELQRLRDQDSWTVSFDGDFAAQLASKSIGIVDPLQTTSSGSHTFHAVDILAEHRRLRETDFDGATVVLVLSTDYGKRQLYQGKPLWVTFALDGFADRDAVRTWCAHQYPQYAGQALENQCVARRLEPPRD